MIRLLSLALILSSTTAHAADSLGPVDYVKILTESKLRYQLQTTPAKTPAAAMTCPPRDETMRVVTKPDGEKELVLWQVKAEAEKLIKDAEALYQAKKYVEAAAMYQAAIEIDPEAVNAHAFYGDTLLFGANDSAAALEAYKRAIALDPTLPMPHFFASTAYGRLGQKAEAREEIIRALVTNPVYETVWKVVAQSPESWNIKPVQRHKFSPPAGYLGAKTADGIEVFGGADGEWLGYAICKAAWDNEPQFAAQRSPGGWSLAEERACVMNQLMGAFNASEARLKEQEKKQKRGKRRASIPEAEILANLPPLERHLFEAASAQLLDGYILFEIMGQRCPISVSLLTDEARQKLEGYVRKFIIVAAD